MAWNGRQAEAYPTKITQLTTYERDRISEHLAQLSR